VSNRLICWLLRVRSFYLCRTHFGEEAKLEKEEEKKREKK
jgi:hypothetical protein